MTKETFMGFPLLARVPKAQPHTPEYDAFTLGAAQWRKWGATDPLGDIRIAEGVARELEIERDYGVRVAVNPRC